MRASSFSDSARTFFWDKNLRTRKESEKPYRDNRNGSRREKEGYTKVKDTRTEALE